jgi:3-deoxy-manno-octulosonate cytidylyltransferase (CMP-KDO synthetase)
LAILVIPARFDSKRLPGKPLLAQTGRPLIAHVIERARSAGEVARVIVATDDDRIRRAAEAAGAEGMMTAPTHRCGTERVAEVARALTGEDLFVNLQGDEPEMEPADIDLLVGTLREAGTPLATLAAPLSGEDAFRDPSVVKVVTDDRGDALYFSRAPIPHDRDGSGDAKPLRHLGIYAYTREALLSFASLSPSPLERSERLEQLRALQAGMRIRVALVREAPPGIDTMDAYEAFVARQAGRAAGN